MGTDVDYPQHFDSAVGAMNQAWTPDETAYHGWADPDADDTRSVWSTGSASSARSAPPAPSRQPRSAVHTTAGGKLVKTHQEGNLVTKTRLRGQDVLTTAMQKQYQTKNAYSLMGPGSGSGRGAGGMAPQAGTVTSLAELATPDPQLPSHRLAFRSTHVTLNLAPPHGRASIPRRRAGEPPLRIPYTPFHPPEALPSLAAALATAARMPVQGPPSHVPATGPGQGQGQGIQNVQGHMETQYQPQFQTRVQPQVQAQGQARSRLLPPPPPPPMMQTQTAAATTTGMGLGQPVDEMESSPYYQTHHPQPSPQPLHPLPSPFTQTEIPPQQQPQYQPQEQRQQEQALLRLLPPPPPLARFPRQ